MEQLFSKSGPQAAYFLQSTFHEHFDDLQLKTIKGKLTLDADRGIIKINKEFSPNYRNRLEREKQRNQRELTKQLEEEQKQKKFEAQADRREKAEERYRQHQSSQTPQPTNVSPSKDSKSGKMTDDDKAYASAAKFREEDYNDNLDDDLDGITEFPDLSGSCY